MSGIFKRFLLIRNSFLLVLILIQLLLTGLAFMLTRLTLRTIDEHEAETREHVIRYVTNTVDNFSANAEVSALAVAANERYMQLFAQKDREGLLKLASPFLVELKQHNIKQFQFTSADFKVLLRVHNPSVFGDDVTTSRPTLVECIAEKHQVAGLEQGRSGYGFRSVAPAVLEGQFLGCVELGSDLDQDFLEKLNANYAGRWAIVNLDKGVNLTRDVSVLNSINEPAGSDILSRDYTTPAPILKSLLDLQPAYEYRPKSEEMVLYIPVRNFKGTPALYFRYVSHTPYYATVRAIIINALVISLLGMLLTGLVFRALYGAIRNPVHQLVIETEKIKNFDLKDRVVINTSLTDLQTLVKAVADMKMGLQSFQKYVPANLVRQLIETNQEARIGGKLRELTVFFSDISDFTAITEQLSPNELTLQLSEYFDHVTAAILAHKGTVDKFIGDAVMAFWGAPIEIENQAFQACGAALECQRQVRELSKKWKAEGKYEFRTRIGLNTGEIVVGNIGSEQRLNYTVIGDPVNLASRLEGLNKAYQTEIIISEETYERCRDSVEVRLLDFVIVKGKSEPVRIYELIGEKGDISPRRKEFITRFNKAIDLYLAREWDAALKILSTLLEKEPEDFVTKLYIKRCQEFEANPPDPDWVGQFRYETK
jgi:class 3 adenylate cyclase